MDEVFEPDKIDVQVDDFVKTKSVSRSKDEFINVLCEDSDDEPVEGEGENARVELDDEENTDEFSDEDEIIYSIHNLKVKWNVMKPVIGERYESRHELKLCLTNYSIYKGYKIRFKKCDSVRLVVVCVSDPEKCSFMVRASWMSTEKSFQVKKMNDRHTCVRNFSSSRLMNPTWLAKQFVKELVRKPKLKCKEMQTIIQIKFHCKDYGHELMRSNPGSTVRISVNFNPDQTTTFHRIYVCFKAIKDGWKIGCRSVIGLDGCFLKGQCKGELLTTIGRDANNQIYPIAWAVVEVENQVNWTWFFELVSEDLSLDAGRGLSVISDQHKGLVEATKDILPHCARHIYAHFRKVYSRIQFRNMFWVAAKSTTEGDFKINMDGIKTLSEGAYDHLMAREPHTWCRAFFGSGLACESVENGIAKCFNAVIVDARKKPLLSMLEEIRLYMMERFYNLREEAQKLEGDINVYICWTWYAVPSGVNSYEIRNGFQSYGVAILYTNQDPKEFISTWFSKSNYMATYQSNILPVTGSNLWEETGYTKPLPPTARRMPGRPSVKRRRHASEHEDKYPQVSNKGRTGHNKASCKNPKVVPTPKPKNKMGRPKLDPDLTNWTGSRRGDRGGNIESGRRGKRGGGRGSGGRGRGNTKFGEGTSNLDEENVVTPTVESDNEEARDVESPEVDDEIRVDVKSDINFMRQSNYTTQDILDCLGINEEELYECEGLKHVPVELNISQGFEFPSQLTIETLTGNEEGMEQEGLEIMNQDGMDPEGIVEEDIGIEGIDEEGMEQEGMDQEGMNQDGMGAQGLDQEGFNENDIGEEGMEQEGMDQDGMNQDGMGAQGLDQEGINENGIGEEGMEQEGMDQEGLVVEDMGRRPKLRKRKTSERITKIQLKKLVVVKNGKGMSSSNPLSRD
uniref:Transposase MuDR plant domain-containing protein n=1 Tax=Lactuca sativa TaxID=4236 RepID=A0A9R1VJF5_LACSA|nr:hypothetical protein LSAT_V11C500284100 [Lactuca sativa]